MTIVIVLLAAISSLSIGISLSYFFNSELLFGVILVNFVSAVSVSFILSYPIIYILKDFVSISKSLELKTSELLEINIFHKTLFTELPHSVILVKDGKATNCNPLTLEIFGCETESEILNAAPSEFSPEYQPNGQLSIKLLGEYLNRVANGEKIHFTWQHIKKDKTPFWAEIWLKKIELNNEIYIQAITQDISTKVKNENLIIRQYEDLKLKGKELEKSQLFHQTLFNEFSQAILIFKDGKFINVNNNTLKLFGYENRKDFIGTHPMDLSPEYQPNGTSSKEEIEQHIKKVINGESLHFKWQHLKKDKTPFWAKIWLKRIVIEDEIFIQSITEDITHKLKKDETIIFQNKKLLKKEKELQDSLDYNKYIIEFTPSAIFTVSLDKKITFWNKQAELITEYSQDEIIGKDCSEFAISPCDEFCSLFDIHNAKTVSNKLSKIKTKSGKIKYVEKNTDYIYDNDGNKSGGIESFIDVTKRILNEEHIKEVSKTLEKSEKLYKAIFEESHDAIFLVYDNKFMKCNPKTLEVFGCENFNEIINHNPADFSPEYQKNGRKSSDIIPILLKDAYNGIPQTFEWIHKQKNGTNFNALVSLKSITLDNKTYIQAVVRDITQNVENIKKIELTNTKLKASYSKLKFQTKELEYQKIEIEKQKEKAEDATLKAEKASYYKSIFLANMSHEIRTPLNGILGITNILKEGILSDKQKELTDILKTSGNNLLTIINDIIDYSKIEANQLDLESISINLKNEISEVYKILEYKTRNKKLDFKLNFDDEIPKNIIADPIRIKQVIINFVNNAIKFTNKGYVEIKISLNRKTENNVNITFKVIDTGIGIPKSAIQLLFTEFHQVDATTTRKYGGSGLGLAISKRLVGLMNSKIDVQSELGKGSIFSFSADFEISNEKELITIDNLTDYKIENIIILLVDDNPINIKVAEYVLKKITNNILIATNGKEAFELYKTTPIDVILMDIQMPVMDGYEATKKIREYEIDVQKTPCDIIALTANALKGEKEKCLYVGMNDYLSKPFKPESLITIIKNHKL